MHDTVEADLVAHITNLYAAPLGEVHRDERCIWFLTGDDSPHHNGILKAALDDADVANSVGELLVPFKEAGVPMMWWFFTGPEGLSAHITVALAEEGFVLDSDRPSMELDLGAFRPVEPLSFVETQRVTDMSSFKEWVDVVGRAFETEDNWSSLSTRSFLQIGWNDAAPFRHYVTRLEGRAVGAATLSVGGGVAGLANISTVPEHRRKGIGRAVTSALLLDAKAMGLTTAALSADEAGSHLYRSLGFTEIGRHLTFVRRL